jgi:hypothetical protein
MLTAKPHGEDGTDGNRALPVTINSDGTPPGEDGLTRGLGELENNAQEQAAGSNGIEDDDEESIDFLHLIREAESQALLYVAQVNRRAWSQSLRAYHNEHYVGSKYTRPDWRGRSKLFVPKTRAAVRKDLAAVAASLFNSVDAINCTAGNEGDQRNRASAAIMQELVNYRTDRASGKAAFPWFQVAMGSRQDSLLTGICATKQCWRQEFRKSHTENVDKEHEETGEVRSMKRDVYKLDVDRPDMLLIPPENIVIDAAADWTDPAQTSAFLIIKWPMQLEEIKSKQNSPVNPWNPVSEEVLKNSVESGKFDMAAIRRAREMGLDRLDETQTGTHFQIIWVYETFMRVDGEDYCFYSVGDKAYLTDPSFVRDVYPEQFGERPISIGYGSLESHRIYPMSPVESWQPLQLEVNDLRNLMLDATKQNVMPITKVRRGRQIDLDQVKRRSSGSSIMVNDKDDVTWENPPQMGTAGVEMTRELNIEMDDAAGQQNYGTVADHNSLGRTLGGLKLAAGAANAVQEYDIRVWIETWAVRALSQIVRLEQYYENDTIVLGLVGQKAKLFEKYGINQIDDQLLEQDVTVRVSAGLGSGDPQQRLAKFQSAASIIGPIALQSPQFQKGEMEIDIEAMWTEVWGAAGYKDGGARFIKMNQGPRQDPMGDLKQQEIMAKIQKDKLTGQAAFLTGIANIGKVALGKRELEANVVDQFMGRQLDAHTLGFEHGHRHNDQHLSAVDHGHRHGLAIADHRRNLANDAHAQAMAKAEAQNPDGGGAETGNAGRSSAAPSAAPQEQPSASSPPTAQPEQQPTQALMQLIQTGKLEFTRDPKTGRISGIRMPQQTGGGQYPALAGPR